MHDDRIDYRMTNGELWSDEGAMVRPLFLNGGQSRLMSLVEAKSNAVVGLLVSWLFTYFCLPWFGLEPSPLDATGITACYFHSVVRALVCAAACFQSVGADEVSNRPDHACGSSNEFVQAPAVIGHSISLLSATSFLNRRRSVKGR